MISFLDIAGLYLHIAGFIIGLGAVTVIDLHGLFARKSQYWTEATIRTHKITKPLIWLGLTLAILGGGIFYRTQGFKGIFILQPILIIPLVLNGIFLSFVVSPYLLKQEKLGKSRELLPQDLQLKITLSFIVSVIGWWGELLLLVLRLLNR